MMLTRGSIAAIATVTVITASMIIIFLSVRPGPSNLALMVGTSHGCESGSCAENKFSERPRLTIATAYLACSELAKQRILNSTEAHECGLNYIRLKLAFLPEVSIEGFMAMPPAQRFEVNRMGYLLYLRWKEEDAQFLEHLRKLARAGTSVSR
jgi:hypothetical protein